MLAQAHAPAFETRAGVALSRLERAYVALQQAALELEEASRGGAEAQWLIARDVARDLARVVAAKTRWGRR